MNGNHRSHDDKIPRLPDKIELGVPGGKGWIVLDQIRKVDKSRLMKKPGAI